MVVTYWFSTESIRLISNLIKSDIERQTSINHALESDKQVLVALRFFANNSFLELVGDTLGRIPKCTISRIITRVSTALASKNSKSIKWPSSVEEAQMEEGFFDKGGFTWVIGFTKGAHIQVQGPSRNKSDFVNRKGFHSINVQAVCNHKG